MLSNNLEFNSQDLEWDSKSWVKQIRSWQQRQEILTTTQEILCKIIKLVIPATLMWLCCVLPIILPVWVHEHSWMYWVQHSPSRARLLLILRFAIMHIWSLVDQSLVAALWLPHCWSTPLVAISSAIACAAWHSQTATFSLLARTCQRNLLPTAPFVLDSFHISHYIDSSMSNQPLHPNPILYLCIAVARFPPSWSLKKNTFAFDAAPQPRKFIVSLFALVHASPSTYPLNSFVAVT